jgi:hypothetical protein
MTEPGIGTTTTTTVPAADVVAPAGNEGPIVHQSFPLRQAEEDANEIMVGIRGRVLRRVRSRLTSLIAKTFPWPEVLLGLATLSFGGLLGALGSSLPWAVIDNGTPSPNFKAVFFYVALPVFGAAAAVGFLSLRHFSARSTSDVASAVLDELPDPDRTSQPKVQ